MDNGLLWRLITNVQPKKTKVPCLSLCEIGVFLVVPQEYLKNLSVCTEIITGHLPDIEDGTVVLGSRKSPETSWQCVDGAVT